MSAGPLERYDLDGNGAREIIGSMSTGELLALIQAATEEIELRRMQEAGETPER